MINHSSPVKKRYRRNTATLCRSAAFRHEFEKDMTQARREEDKERIYNRMF